MASGREGDPKALSTCIRELQTSLDAHYSLMINLLQGGADNRSLQALLAQSPKGSREHRLELAIREAIEVLEETRKSFKSKQLAELRKRLTEALIEGP